MPGKKAYLSDLIERTEYAVISEEDYIKIRILKHNYNTYADGILPKLLKHTKREVSIYGELDGVPMRVRPDSMAFKENIGVNAIISIKSTRAESLAHFYYQSAKLKYETKEAAYQRLATEVTGRDFLTTIMIGFQTVAPFGVFVLFWNPEDIEVGKYKLSTGLENIKSFEESGIYRGFDIKSQSGDMGFINMKQPDWNKKEIHPVDPEV